MPSANPFFSSSSAAAAGGDDDDAVEAILAEAADLVALEQVAKLNTAHLSDSNLLPSELEARFRKLKSFPAANPRSTIAAPPSLRSEKENFPKSLNRSDTAPVCAAEAKNSDGSIAKGDGDPNGHVPPPATKDPVTPEASKKPKSRSKAGIGSSPSFSSRRGSLSPSPSPPRQRCCFGYSPKKSLKTRNGKGDDILAELDLLCLKEEQRKLKKALREQEKVNKEAEKMVKLVKEASKRMNVAAVDEWPSDDEEEFK